MEKTSIYNLTRDMHNVKRVDLVLWTHYNSTGAEKCNEVTKISTKADKFAPTDTYEFRDYSVIMFEAVKKGHLKIWGYREVE